MNFITKPKICQEERNFEMEQRYKAALEIIKRFCEQETYIDTKQLLLICNTVLEESEGKEDVCTR